MMEDPPLRVTAEGQSKRWKNGKKAASHVWTSFTTKRPEDMFGHTPCGIEILPAEFISSIIVWENFAGYIVQHRKVNGKFLLCDSVINYFQTCFRKAKDRFKDKTDLASLQAHKFFSSALDRDNQSDVRDWMKGIKWNLRRICMSREVATEGHIGDASAVPIYKNDLKNMCDHWATQGISGAMRKAVLTSAFQTTGRTAETAYVTHDGFEFDQHRRVTYGEVPQFKTAKVKPCCFVCSLDRNICWFKGMGDYWSMTPRGMECDGLATWVFPSLHTVEQPGTMISGFIKTAAALDGNPCHLPSGATRASLRPGAISELLQRVPSDIVVVTSGHEAKINTTAYAYFGNMDFREPSQAMIKANCV